MLPFNFLEICSTFSKSKLSLCIEKWLLFMKKLEIETLENRSSRQKSGLFAWTKEALISSKAGLQCFTEISIESWLKALYLTILHWRCSVNGSSVRILKTTVVWPLQWSILNADSSSRMLSNHTGHSKDQICFRAAKKFLPSDKNLIIRYRYAP